MNHLLSAKLVVSLLVMLAIVPSLLAQGQPPPASQPTVGQTRPAQPQTQPADPGLHPRVTLETSLGNIVLELDAE